MTTPALEQLALAELLVNGHIDRHLRRLRVTYRVRRDAVVAAVADAVPSLQPTGISAGLHLLIKLNSSGATEHDVQLSAHQRGVALAYLGPH